MGLRKILIDKDPALHKVCKPVTSFDKKLHKLLDDMRETLINSQGVGLAAPQVGILRRLALVMVEDESFLEIINPEIIAREGEQDGAEGCLSVPGKYGMVKRPMQVTVKFQDRHGEWHERTAEGFTARAFCHEIDHLDGHLYTELVSEYLDPSDFADDDDDYEGEDE